VYNTHFIEMRNVVQGDDYQFIHLLHMAARAYRARVDHVFDFHLKYHIDF
jgi:hypothetical protein